MRQYVIADRVQGFSHKKGNTPCQDAFCCRDLDGAHLIAVADGHGSKSCLYSEDGSRIAVEVFCDILENLYSAYAHELSKLHIFLNREGNTTLARSVQAEWRKRILAFHNENHAEDDLADEEEIYHLYGTTLLGLLATEEFCFAFQLGDGDISYVSENHATPMVESEKYLGTEVNSLCSPCAWEKAATAVW